MNDADHKACVEAWIRRSDALSPSQLVVLFERAVCQLFDRAKQTLGVVTLAAIVDRVVYTASERYTFLGTLEVDENGVRFDAFRKDARILTEQHLVEAIRFVLEELLTVLGNLSAEILTPALHAALAAVSPADSNGAASRRSEPISRKRADREGEEP